MDPLTDFGTRHGTDKVTHGFCSFYHRHLAAKRHDVSKVLEIGVLRGASLQMWQDYFPNAEIHGVDEAQPSFSPPHRIHLHVGDQADRQALDHLIQVIGSDLDIIVDDGGHTMGQQQVSLAFLFPHLRPGGLYILEDLHTSFMESIALYRNGRIVHRYSTGVDECRCTTYHVVDAFVRRQPFYSDYMSAPEMEFLAAEVDSAEIFDRDGDRAHITSIIRKRLRPRDRTARTDHGNG